MSLPGMGRDQESLCSLFHACDVDHSGQIEKYEFIKICSELNVPPTEREHIFSKLDTDRDGTINLAEFISGFHRISEQVYCGDMESKSWGVSSQAWEDFQTRLGDHARFIPRSSMDHITKQSYRLINTLLIYIMSKRRRNACVKQFQCTF